MHFCRNPSLEVRATYFGIDCGNLLLEMRMGDFCIFEEIPSWRCARGMSAFFPKSLSGDAQGRFLHLIIPGGRSAGWGGLGSSMPDPLAGADSAVLCQIRRLGRIRQFYAISADWGRLGSFMPDPPVGADSAVLC